VNTDRAARWYRAILVIAPPRLRHRHGREMESLFIESLADARPRGTRATAAVWWSASVDVLRAWIWRPVKRRSSLPPRAERRELMLGTDVRYTFRWLARQKLSTSLVVAMLALGIAANVVVFSLVNGLFLRPFPFPASDRLVYINETAPKWNLDIVGINYPDFDTWRKGVKLFDGIALFDETSFNLSDDKGAERINGARVTHDYAQVMGITPILGRMFTADEDKPKATPVVVLGEGIWKERFQGAGEVLGKTLKLNGVAHTIVGVVPQQGEFPAAFRLWTPLAGDPLLTYQSYSFEGVGRLKPGVRVEDATRDLVRSHQVIWDARDKDHTVTPFARALHEQFARDFRSQATTLMIAVIVLLFVACANVASVMLARALARRREMGIRLAVGASRTRLAQQLFVENLTLAVLGGTVGLALGSWGLRTLLSAAGDLVPPWASFGLDVRVIGFSIVVTVATTLLFGWAPALHAIRGNLRSAMHAAGSSATSGPGGRRTLSVLVAAEFGLAAALLVCGGLLMRAYDRVQRVDPGYRVDGVLTFALALPEATYATDEKRLQFWKTVEDRFRQAPGVEAAGIVSCPPLTCHWGTFFDIEGRAPLAPGEANPVTLVRPASPGYFAAMGVRLIHGRFFDDNDGPKRPAIIVNETFVKTFWPGVTDPVGRRIRGNGSRDAWMTVVGMVADVKHYGLERPMRPGVYLPLAQNPAPVLSVALRTTGDPVAFTNSARSIVTALDPELPLYRVRTMEEALRRSMAQRVLYSALLGLFAIMALVLALGGTYGVTSYLVSQRTREIGIRVALGARNLDIIRIVLSRSLLVASAGIVIGVAAASSATGLISDLLFGVPPHDPRVLSGAAALLLGMAALANFLPARRAARVEPMRTLRTD
jgi:putative ABC transport system permease protein